MSAASSRPSRGVVYVAYGAPAVAECGASISSLLATNPGMPIAVISDRHGLPAGYPYQHIEAVEVPDDPGARLRKLSVPALSPFDHTLYLDADTRIHGDLSPLFALLDYWPLAMTYSVRQGEDVLGNCGPEDRERTFATIGTRDVLGLQCGVIALDTKEPRVHRLFAAWIEEWASHRDRDQAAFLRALHREPLPIHLIGRDWNGGSIIEHRYGAAARTH